MTLKDLLRNDLSASELGLLKRSFDQIGSIAQLEIPDELKGREKIIARKVLDNFKNVETVVKKDSKTLGEYRIRSVKFLAGERTTETIHKENGIRLKLDLNKVFFTPRLSNERLRVLNTVKKGDVVADLFCGVGPYAVLIAKFSKCRKVVANDLNKDAYDYLVENVKLNKVGGGVEAFNKDAREFNIKADKLIMNIPKFSSSFLDVAFRNVKKNGRVYYYTFASSDELPLKIREIKANGKCRILSKTKCGDISPGVFRWCVDFKKL